MPSTTNYNLGDIILLEFPHADLQHFSKRPAIVLYDSGDRDVLVARITTQDIQQRPITKFLNGKRAAFSQNRISDWANRQP